MKRLAVIDLGTNTFNLLIVDQKDSRFEEVYGTKVGVGLGLGGINSNFIREDAVQRALDTIKIYRQKCIDLNVGHIKAFGTSAIRNAANKELFVQRVKTETGIDVEVISGAREAELIYKGVNLKLKVDEPFIIMDIGGGSTEFILGDCYQLVEAASFEIGAARIFQAFDFSDPYTEEDCRQIEAYLEKGVGTFFDGIQVLQLIGASGSFETFYELIHNQPYPGNEYVTLSMTGLKEKLTQIIFSTKAEREADDRIIPIRKKMAPIAAVKIRWIIRKLNIQKVMISPYSMKQGVLHELTDENQSA